MSLLGQCIKGRPNTAALPSAAVAPHVSLHPWGLYGAEPPLTSQPQLDMHHELKIRLGCIKPLPFRVNTLLSTA